MKKLFAIAFVMALAACGGKAKTDDTMKNTGGDMGTGSGTTEGGGATYGGDAYGNPCAGGANPCAGGM